MHFSRPRSFASQSPRQVHTGLAYSTIIALSVALLIGGCSSATPAPEAEPGEGGVSLEEASGAANSAADAAVADEPDEAEPVDNRIPPPIEPTATTGTTLATIITGQVTDSAGEPITDASVAIVESSAPFPEMAIFTDASGTYTWYVQPGTYTIEVYRDGYVNNKGDTEVAEGTSAQLDFVLESR